MKLISSLVAAAVASSVFAGASTFNDIFSSKAIGAVDEKGYMVFPKASDKSPFAECYREKLDSTGEILRTRDTVDVIFGDADSAKKYAVEYALASSPEVILHVPAEIFKSTHDRVTAECTPQV